MRCADTTAETRQAAPAAPVLGILCALLSLAATQIGFAAETGQPRVLLLGVESIPYDLAVSLTDPALGEAAILRDLAGPTAVINSFPSSSYTAWTALLKPFGIARPRGYIGKYFDGDRATRKLPAGEERAPWEHFFDWRLEGLGRKAIAYGRSRQSAQRELREGLEAFARSDQPLFAIYLISPDGVGHLHGPAGLREFLLALDAALGDFRREHPELAFHTVIVSDHGMAGGEPLDNVWPEVQAAVKSAGYDQVVRLKNEDDTLFMPYGLLSNFPVFTWQGREQAVAEIIAGVQGVDLCVIPRGDGWRILSARGHADVRREQRDDGLYWSYEAPAGDPLGYGPALERLRARTAESEGWYSDEQWLEEIGDSHYPDALHRLATSFEIVQHPASVHCSTAPGYVFGARRMEFITRPTVGALRWTHGALHREATLGFMMSDLPGWSAPPRVRAEQALELLRVYRGAAQTAVLAAP